jgi:pimeloyl-ACP methyl ester carboxylesterase
LNRYSFGPFPDFFLSRGYAVIVYDKRGTGNSNGNLEKATFDDLAADGRAAVHFLKGRKGITQIGLCGSSQGGFLAALVASGNRDVAFIINLYGMYVPAWQQELYRAEAEMREGALSETERAEALAFMKLEFDVGRTGQDWERLAAEMRPVKTKKWFESVPHFSDLNELVSDWRTVYSYDPALALEKVTCPVLALFGALDNSTPVPQTIANMQRALKTAGNSNFTYRVFPKGNHGLLESETGYNSEIPKLKRFVPGLFETMTIWLRRRGAAIASLQSLKDRTPVVRNRAAA